nr:FtsX-like permease family protein [Nocardioides daedukensis]
MLRALGLERPGLRHLLMLRVLLTGVIGVLVGLPLGAALAVLTTRAVAASLGVTTELSVTWLPIVVLVPLVLMALRIVSATAMDRPSYVRPARVLAEEM